MTEQTRAVGAAVARFRRRMRVLLCARWTLWGAAFGSAAAVALFAVNHFRPTFHAWWSLLALGAGALLGAVTGLVLPVSAFDTARAVETRSGLKERVSSALRLPKRLDPAVGNAITRDAQSHLLGLRARRLFPWRPRGEGWAFGVLVFVAGLLAVLPPGTFLTPEARADRADVQSRGEELTRLVKELSKTPPPSNADVYKQVLKNLERLSKDMQAGKISKEEALVKLNELRKQLDDQRLPETVPTRTGAEAAQAYLDQRMQERAERDHLTALNSDSPEQRAALAEQLKKMAEQKRATGQTSGGDNTALDQAAEQLSADDLKALAEAVEKGEGARLTKEQWEALKPYLNQLKQQGANAQTLPVDPQALQDLMDLYAKLLANQDYQEALRLFNELIQKLQQQAQQAQQNGKPAQMSEQDLKELAERMKQLADMLKNTNLDELAKKMREFAEHLQNCKECQQALLNGSKGGGT